MKKIAIIFTLFFVSLQNLRASTTTPPVTIISSNVIINQAWISNNPAPWTISSNVTVTFGENLSLNSASQYFIITGSNVTIDGANKSVTLNGISNFPGLVNAQETNASSALIKNIGVNTIGNTNLSLGGGYISTMFNKATITNCFSTGEISGELTGGIAGGFNFGNINNCFSTGAISSIGSGGITSFQTGRINNCYSTGLISGIASGGIVGYINSGSINNCYSTGLISGLASGGITSINANSIDDNPFFGDEILSGNISNCYTSGEIIGVINNEEQYVAGGIAAYNISTITDCRSSGSLSNINSVGIAINNFIEFGEQTGEQINASHVTPVIPNTFDNSIANQVLTGLGSIWNTSISPYSLISFFDPPTFANPGPITICQNGSYFLDPSTTNATWSSSNPSVATVDSKGYVTGLITGTTTISLENSGGTVSASVTVGSSSELSITDPLTQASYKFNNNPQGPIGGTINYVGYNGFNYISQTRPINTGFYRASKQSSNESGCPYEYYIFRCTTCGTVSEYATRPQGTLIGNTIQSNGTGQLTYTSSSGVGPFTIVYQLIGGDTKTVTNVSSGQAFNIDTYTSTTSYKLISVTDETIKSSTDFANTIGTISVVPPPTATLSGELTICPGTTATLTLTTTGTGNIAVTLSNGIIVNTTSGTTTFSVSPTINTTYTISSVLDAYGTGTYSGNASLTINNTAQPVITSQPIASVTFIEGASTTLSVTATDAVGYQWYKDGSNILGANTISYTTVNTLSATGTYYVMVYGTCISISSTNSVVSVTAMPQGILTGSVINEGQTGYLSFISSNNPVGGPFTIVYQPSGGSNITVTNVTSGATISLTTGTPTRTITYTLVSVTDETTTLSRSTGFTAATATITVNLYHVGQSYGGGIVFYVDGTGEHGLIAATSNELSTLNWADAINACNNKSIDDVYSDWYLPSKDELDLMYLNGGTIGFPGGFYWSSTEFNSSNAYIRGLSSSWNNSSDAVKTLSYFVRAIRAF